MGVGLYAGRLIREYIRVSVIRAVVYTCRWCCHEGIQPRLPQFSRKSPSIDMVVPKSLHIIEWHLSLQLYTHSKLRICAWLQCVHIFWLISSRHGMWIEYCAVWCMCRPWLSVHMWWWSSRQISTRWRQYCKSLQTNASHKICKVRCRIGKMTIARYCNLEFVDILHRFIAEYTWNVKLNCEATVHMARFRVVAVTHWSSLGRD